MFGRTRFPAIGELPYLLTLAPRGFFWFQLRTGGDGMTFDEQALIEYVTQQRWYGAKSRAVAHSQVLDAVVLRTTEPQFALALVEMRYDTGAHDIYQLLYALRDGEIAIDGLDDPQLARELVQRDALRADAAGRRRASSSSVRSKGFAGLGRELLDARPVGAEQSNTSLVFDDELILKVFRRLEPGHQPRARDAALPHRARLREHRAARRLVRVLGRAARRDARDPAAVRARTASTAGSSRSTRSAARRSGSSTRLRRLGEVTGEMHTVLALRPERPGVLPRDAERRVARPAHGDGRRGDRAASSSTLPDGDERLAPIVGRGEEVREQLRMLTHAGSTGKSIRTHGDYHLGQTLWADDDWVILDFEGEPARVAPERRRKRSPLRDVAGMLRSFAYAASAAEPLRGTRRAGRAGRRRRASSSSRAISRRSSRRSCRPGQVAIERLLAVFELEKAVYELRYELDNRPDWVGIPVAGIQRLIDTGGWRHSMIELGADPHGVARRARSEGRRRRARVPPRGAVGARAAGRASRRS